MKCLVCVGVTLPLKSLPVRGAWIEMVETLLIGIVRSWSLPVRGAWIEIFILEYIKDCEIVAPCEGSVD